jgi:drug/metabolite transporter (DMT)-like permease
VTRNILRNRQPLVVTFSIFLPVAMLVGTYLVFTSDWSRFLQLPAKPIIAMLYLGFISLTVAHWFWQEAVARVGAAKAGLFLYLEPLATTALAVPLLGEYFGIFTIIGGLLVLGGVYLSQHKRAMAQQRR